MEEYNMTTILTPLVCFHLHLKCLNLKKNIGYDNGLKIVNLLLYKIVGKNHGGYWGKGNQQNITQAY
jgi:hypothetical protein